MEKIWIIGVGRFGSLAFQRLSKAGGKRHFVLVDPVEDNLSRCQGPACTREKADGVLFLKEHLQWDGGPDWIIPALPVHLAAEWILLRLGPDQVRRISLPPEMDHLLPNPMRGTEGNIYVTHATFRCPDDCAEPKNMCTVTGKKRGQNMFDLLGGLVFPPFRSLNIRSHQLAPGVGGYRPAALFSLLEPVQTSKVSLMVSTACRCHGVITGMERASR
ncbi:MAG: potassium transporter [Deltaproteobacteria bacterium]|nr:potassium transporter [Deltaproteobacteria bacterium]